jgi:hypothetical protein
MTTMKLGDDVVLKSDPSALMTIQSFEIVSQTEDGKIEVEASCRRHDQAEKVRERYSLDKLVLFVKPVVAPVVVDAQPEIVIGEPDPVPVATPAPVDPIVRKRGK